MTAAAVGGARQRDLVWLTWRQYRAVLVIGVLVVVALIGFELASYLALGRYVCATFCIDAARNMTINRTGELLTVGNALFAAFVAVFWAAPLVAREYEARTYVVAWTQDVTPERWLVSRTAHLLVATVVLAAVVGLAGTVVVDRIQAIAPDWNEPFASYEYESSIPLQIAYAVFGFALGLLVSLTLRRTVMSIGVTVVGFAITRIAVAIWARPHFLPPARALGPVSDHGSPQASGLFVASGFVDNAGNQVSMSVVQGCAATGDGYPTCLADHGVAHRFLDYQPADRVGTFQLIEFAIFAVLAIGLLALAWMGVRRITRVG